MMAGKEERPRQEHEAGIGALVSAVIAYLGPRIAPTLALVGLAAVLESVGIVLLLPLAETIFSQSDSAAQSNITDAIGHGLSVLGAETVLEQLAFMGLGLVVFLALRAWVLILRDVKLLRLSQGFVDHERRNLFVKLAHADWPTIKRYRKADLLNAMTTNIGRLSSAMQYLTRGLVTIAMGLAGLVAAFFVSWMLGLLLCFLVAMALFLALVWGRSSRKSGEQLTLANRGVMTETTRFLDGMKAAKTTLAEEILVDGFSTSIAGTRAIQIAFTKQQAQLRYGIQLLAAVAALGVLVVGFAILGLTGAELLVMAAIILRLAPSLTSTLSGMQSFAHALPAFTAIRALDRSLSREQEVASLRPSAVMRNNSWVGVEAAPLEIDNAAVRLANGAGDMISLVHTGRITIPPGKLVHIGGPSGAGKSTLAELIAGLHLPATGSVSRGEMVLTQATRRQWQECIAFAPQEAFVFDASVRANLLWPDRQVEDAVLWQMLEDVRAAELVRALPGGLDDQLLDGGARISGGERQRLCLARALLRKAHVLVLDEATSAMDPDLERAVVKTLKLGLAGRIAIMVSHSHNAAELADMRIEVEGGVARVLN